MAVLRVLVDESLPRSVGPPLEALGIDVVDHVIIGDGVYVSMKEKGLL